MRRFLWQAHAAVRKGSAAHRVMPVESDAPPGVKRVPELPPVVDVEAVGDRVIASDRREIAAIAP